MAATADPPVTRGVGYESRLSWPAIACCDCRHLHDYSAARLGLRHDCVLDQHLRKPPVSLKVDCDVAWVRTCHGVFKLRSLHLVRIHHDRCGLRVAWVDVKFNLRHNSLVAVRGSLHHWCPEKGSV